MYGPSSPPSVTVSSASAISAAREKIPSTPSRSRRGARSGCTWTVSAGIGRLDLRLRLYHRDQHVRRPLRPEVQRRLPAEDLRRPVARVVVQERPAAQQLVLEVGELRAGRLLP